MACPPGSDRPVTTTPGWEEVSCPLCGTRREEELIATPGDVEQAVYRVVRCGACGMGYLNPRPMPACIARYYPDDYMCYQPSERRRVGWRHQLWHRLQGLLPEDGESLTAIPFRGEGRLLDFGCGSGTYAERMRRRGWSVTGIDCCAEVAHATAKRYGFP